MAGNFDEIFFVLRILAFCILSDKVNDCSATVLGSNEQRSPTIFVFGLKKGPFFLIYFPADIFFYFIKFTGKDELFN